MRSVAATVPPLAGVAGELFTEVLAAGAELTVTAVWPPVETEAGEPAAAVAAAPTEPEETVTAALAGPAETDAWAAGAVEASTDPTGVEAVTDAATAGFPFTGEDTATLVCT